jgi:hypothetical protein
MEARSAPFTGLCFAMDLQVRNGMKIEAIMQFCSPVSAIQTILMTVMMVSILLPNLTLSQYGNHSEELEDSKIHGRRRIWTTASFSQTFLALNPWRGMAIWVRQ